MVDTPPIYERNTFIFTCFPIFYNELNESFRVGMYYPFPMLFLLGILRVLTLDKCVFRHACLSTYEILINDR